MTSTSPLFYRLNAEINNCLRKRCLQSVPMGWATQCLAGVRRTRGNRWSKSPGIARRWCPQSPDYGPRPGCQGRRPGRLTHNTHTPQGKQATVSVPSYLLLEINGPILGTSAMRPIPLHSTQVPHAQTHAQDEGASGRALAGAVQSQRPLFRGCGGALFSRRSSKNTSGFRTVTTRPHDPEAKTRWLVLMGIRCT